MRILIVDDVQAHLHATMLRESAGFDVVAAVDPHEAGRLLRRETFDVIVVDLLFEPLCRSFERRLGHGQVSLSTDREFLVSGLMTLYDAARSDEGPKPALLVWTVGDKLRDLHLAHQEFPVSAWCSKVDDSTRRDGGARVLVEGIRAAAEGRRYVDPVVAPYLPRPRARPLRDMLFGEESWRAVWRAMALGVRGQTAIAKVAGYARPYVRNEMRRMADNLFELDPGLDSRAKPYETLVPFAASNWQFFLDDTVMRMFPPAIANGVKARPDK